MPPRTYTPALSIVPAEEYEIETVYEVGQTFFLPYPRYDDPESAWEIGYIPADAFPEEVITRNQGALLTSKSRINPGTGITEYYFVYAETDGAWRPCADFLEIECAAVTEHSTVWQYTGNVCSNRPTFDPADYREGIRLSADELALITDICDRAYRTEEEIYGDPRRQDAGCDRDGKVAYVVFDYSLFSPTTVGYSDAYYFLYDDFDALFLNAAFLPGRRANMPYAQAKESFLNVISHELNHYILRDDVKYYNSWLYESFAQNAVNAVRPGNSHYLEHCTTIKNECSRIRMLPGMVWGDEWTDYPPFTEMPYTLGDLFLRYVDRRTTGEAADALWTEYFAQQSSDDELSNATMDAFLLRTTGEGLEAWVAQFLASLIVGADEGPYAIEQSDAVLTCRPDLRVFLRDWRDYGQSLTGFDLPGAADGYIKSRMMTDYGLSAVSGGGTAFAYRNDAGGPISVTGADDNWYFFAVTMDLPDPEEIIEISGAEELARIGNDPAYPLSGHYLLTDDIDLGGSPENPWTPIGGTTIPFIGVLDGNGRTISGLYIDNGYDYSGLLGVISGKAVVRDLTVKGSVTGGEANGGIVGRVSGGTVTGCTACVTVTGEFACGGIVGYHYLGEISNCTFSGAVTGEEACGGIAGYNSWARIMNCRSSGGISAADDCAGGIAGMNAGGTVENCHCSGSVSGNVYAGGIVGKIADDGAVRNCSHTGTVSCEETAGSICGGIRTGSLENCYSLFPGLPINGTVLESASLSSNYVLSEEPGGEDTLTAEEFTHPESFAGWDFENIWSLENGVRPILRDVP